MMKILSAKAVAAKTSLSVPHIRRASKDGTFPKPIKLSEARMGWLEDDVDAWITNAIKTDKEGAA